MSLQQISDLSESQIDDLHRLYQHEWWTAGREREDVAAMCDHADAVLGYCDAETGELVAFARVLTDHVFQALLQDVIVAEPHRGRGLGTQLVEDVLALPVLADVDVLDLYCVPDHVSFYERFGFTEDLPKDLQLMRYDPDVASSGSSGSSADRNR